MCTIQSQYQFWVVHSMALAILHMGSRDKCLRVGSLGDFAGSVKQTHKKTASTGLATLSNDSKCPRNVCSWKEMSEGALSVELRAN